MQLSQFVAALQADLAAVAAVGDHSTAEAGRRLSVAIEGSVGLRLVDAFASVAVELSGQLPEGHVEVRLAGRDPQLVYVADEPGEPSPVADDDPGARITLRLPETLKRSVEAAAMRDGISVNTWLVRTLARAAQSPPGRSGNRLTGYGRG